MIRQLVTLVGAALLFAATVHAQEDPDAGAKAKALFTAGMAHFQLEEFDAAIEKWEEGFRIKPVPEFLYNIAQAYRLSSRPEKALSFYQKYLRMNPKAPNRVDVEKQIATLSKIVEQQKKAATSPPTETMRPEGSTETHPVTTKPVETKPAETKPVETKPVETKPAETKPAETKPSDVPTPPAENAVSTSPTDNRPVYKKGWFIGVMVAVGVVVVGAVVAGAVVGATGTKSDSAYALPALRF